MKFNVKFDKILIAILIFGVLIRLAWINSLVERDEGQFAFNTVVNYMPNHELYKQQVFEDNKFPMLYLFYSVPILIFGNNFLMIRLFNNLFFWISCYYFFKISFILLKRKKFAYVATFLYILFLNIPYFEGQLVMSESVALHFTIFGYYTLLKYIQSKKKINLLLTIIFFLLSFLTRITLIINFLVLGIILVNNKKRDYKTIIKGLVYSTIFFIFGLLIFKNQLLFYFHNYFQYFSHIIYVPVTNWYILLLEFSGFLVLIVFGIIEQFKKRKIRFSNYFLIAFVLTLLLGFLPNGYGHFFISVLPFFAILGSLGLYYLFKLSNKYFKIISSILIFVLILINISFWIYQYPDLNWNKFGWNWRYSDSESKNMQENIATELRNLNGNTMLLVWEPYICFKANKKGCTSYLAQFLIPRFSYWKDEFENVQNLITYDIYKDSYKKYNLSINYSMFHIQKKEGYTLLTKK